MLLIYNAYLLCVFLIRCDYDGERDVFGICIVFIEHITNLKHTDVIIQWHIKVFLLRELQTVHKLCQFLRYAYLYIMSQ